MKLGKIYQARKNSVLEVGEIIMLPNNNSYNWLMYDKYKVKLGDMFA